MTDRAAHHCRVTPAAVPFADAGRVWVWSCLARFVLDPTTPAVPATNAPGALDAIGNAGNACVWSDLAAVELAPRDMAPPYAIAAGSVDGTGNPWV